MVIEISTDLAALVSAGSTAVYAVISAASLWLLSRQIRDARRFGAAPALYALLKELDEHMLAVRWLGDMDTGDAETRETISRYLEFFERVEHLRSAGVLPATVLRRVLRACAGGSPGRSAFRRDDPAGPAPVRGSPATRKAHRPPLTCSDQDGRIKGAKAGR